MTPRIEIGSMFPCLRTSFLVCILLSTLITLIVCDCRTSYIFPSRYIVQIRHIVQIEKRIERKSIYKNTQRDQFKMLLVDNCNVHSLTAKEIEIYISN